MSTATRQRSRRTQQKLAELNAEVRALQAQLTRMQRLAALGTMAAMVAHEFNNILTPMLSYAHLAEDGDEEIRAKAVARAIEGSRRATTICNALLDIAGGSSEGMRKVPVAELIDQTLTAMARDPGKDGIRLIRKVPANLTVTTRPTELKQVVLNLLLNARAAVMAKGRDKCISISAARPNANVLIRVADTGVGIPRANLEHIFEPFFTTRNGSGTGLGLSVCRQIVQRLRGRLTVRSQEGKGTVFTISLPANGRRRATRKAALSPAAAKR